MNSAQALMTVPAPILADLRKRYSEPARHYHTWAHIAALLRWYDDRQATLHRSIGVFWAILFHDAVYDPARSDNEAQSARLMVAANPPSITVEDRAFAERAILATVMHLVPEGLTPEDSNDLASFLDMDLSILAAHPDVFDRYEDQIRAEYAHVSEPMFRAGRFQVLKRFAERRRLYFSDWGMELFEAAARVNLERSMVKLTSVSPSH